MEPGPVRPFRGSVPKPKKQAKKKLRGRARPDEPLKVWCEVARAGVCTGRAEVRHHIRRRSQGGTDDASNTLDICDADHRWIHENPTKAYAWGYLAHQWDAPDEVETA